MPVRPASQDDAGGMADLWGAALPFMRSRGLRARPEMSAEEVARDWLVGPPAHAYVYENTDGRLEGFYVTIAGQNVPTDEPLSPAERLAVWIVRPVLGRNEKAATLRELTRFWLGEALERGAVWGWGQVPAEPVSAELSVSFLRSWVPVEVSFRREGQSWLLFYGKLEEARRRLEAVRF